MLDPSGARGSAWPVEGHGRRVFGGMACCQWSGGWHAAYRVRDSGEIQVGSMMQKGSYHWSSLSILRAAMSLRPSSGVQDVGPLGPYCSCRGGTWVAMHILPSSGCGGPALPYIPVPSLLRGRPGGGNKVVTTVPIRIKYRRSVKF